MNSWLRQDSDSDSINKLSNPQPVHPRTSTLTRVGARFLCLLVFTSFIALLTKSTVLHQLSTWSELTVIRARKAVYGNSAAGTAAAAAAHVAGVDTTMPKRHVVLPATGPNRAFCRCLFSLLITGYGAPTVVNWHAEGDPRNYYLKITGLYDWLYQGGHDNDLIVTIDAHDVWAHLPADLFFKQYEDHPFAPNVIVGAEKNCHPGRPSAPYCSKLPESPLPRDIYGRWTDKISKARHKEDYKPSRGPSKKHLDYDKLGSIRPRYINSGTIVGTRKKLKSLYTAMVDKMNLVLAGQMNVTHNPCDQEILARTNLDHIQQDKQGRSLVFADTYLLLFQVISHSYKDLQILNLDRATTRVQKHQRKDLKNLVKRNPVWSKRSVIFNHVTKTIPFFVHLTGPKPLEKTEPWWHSLWFNKNPDEDDSGHEAGKRKQRPVEAFLEHIEKHQEESYGYGMRLANGTWIGFMDVCSEHREFILA